MVRGDPHINDSAGRKVFRAGTREARDIFRCRQRVFRVLVFGGVAA